MTSPDWSKAEIDSRKLTNYLLDLEHPAGHSKAIFFIHHGFSDSMAWQIEEALKAHVLTATTKRTMRTEFGWKFVLEGKIDAPNGKSPLIRSIWIILDGSSKPNFTTAYPIRERK